MDGRIHFVVGGLVGSVVIAGIILSSSAVFADDSYVSTTNIIVPSACSLTATVDTAHSATLINGIYSGGNDYYPNGIGKTTLTAFCNDASGFAIYAVGFSGDEYGANNMIGTNTGTTIPTGTATSGANSQWAMKLTKVTDATAYNPANMTITNGYDDYSAVPDDYEKVANFSSATDQTLGAKLTTTYAAYISNTQPADTYTGKVKYTLVHPASASPEIPAQPVACDGGKICYSPGPSSVTDSMGNQSVSNSATSAELWASNFKREGYGFAGWSDKYNWVLGANDASGNGTGANAGYHIYGPNATITFTAGQYNTEGLSLYAVWVPSAGNLQNWTGCSSMNIGDVTALTDQRDNDTYAVAKLADGKCWMIENLRLDYDADFTESLSQGFGKSTTYGNFIGLAKPETAGFTGAISATEPNTANSIYYSGTQSGTATININTTNFPVYRIPRYCNDNTNTDTATNPNTTVANMTGTDQNVYSYGNYYTWSAALANTIYYDSPTATDADGKTSETVNTSLCPTGWRLPYGRKTGSGNTPGGFYYLNYKINNDSNVTNSTASTNLRAYPNNFLYSGEATDDPLLNDKGGYGYYWSSTAYGINNSYYAYLHGSSGVSPGNSTSDKTHGYPIRCLAGS